MQVLKFGGSSVANAAAMLRVIDIVEKALEEDRTILVSSAISGCTDTLIEIGHLAAQQRPEHRKLLKSLRDKHAGIILELMPQGYREKTLEAVDALFAELAEGSKILPDLLRGDAQAFAQLI